MFPSDISFYLYFVTLPSLTGPDRKDLPPPPKFRGRRNFFEIRTPQPPGASGTNRFCENVQTAKRFPSFSVPVVFQLFDMKKFQQNVSRELRRAYPDRRRLECQCLSAIGFVKNEPDLLDSPIWVLIINVVAMDMLKSKLPPSKWLTFAIDLYGLSLSHKFASSIRANRTRTRRRRFHRGTDVLVRAFDFRSDCFTNSRSYRNNSAVLANV